MQVIGHEAVRNYCELIFGPSARDLRQNEFDDRAVFKGRPSVASAKRQGIPVKTEIIESLQMAW